MSTILDFLIQPFAVGSYLLTVRERSHSQPLDPQGLASATLSHRADFVTDFSVDQLDASTTDEAQRFDELQKVGQRLYKKLFPPAIEEIWNKYKQRDEFLILCLRFANVTASLESLPWETLHDGVEFIGAGAKTTLTRLPLDVLPQTDSLPPIQRPLKLFGFFASPLDLPDHQRLSAEREEEILIEAINDSAGQGHISAELEDEGKLEILTRSLREGYHILHFAGHGVSPHDGGGLLLEDEQGLKRPTTVDEVVRAVASGADSLRLAVISGCQTARTLHIEGFRDLSRELLRHGVPAVISMQFSITDEGGLKFTEILYREISRGVGLERAVHRARRGLLGDRDFKINNDALAIVLFTADGECLQTAEAEGSATQSESSEIHPGDALDLLPYGFFGRRREYRQIRDGFLLHDRRAITVHGIGGIGKTALLTHSINRLAKHLQAVLTFDGRRASLSPETILLEVHRYLTTHGIHQLESRIGKSTSPEILANEIARVLAQRRMLLVFDNFETQLNEQHEIANDNLRIFLATLVQETSHSHFLFATRYLFKLDGPDKLQEVPVGELSRPEARMLLQNLPNLARASNRAKQAAMEIFGRHPYALLALDRHCSDQSLDDALRDASSLNSELREFLALELNYGRLSDRARTVLNRLAAFRGEFPIDAAHWLMGKKDKGYAAEFLLDNWERLRHEVEKSGQEAVMQSLSRMLPERRRTPDVSDSVNELISWGLLTPGIATGGLQSLSVHGLVRDFCRSQQSGDEWRERLREAAKFLMTVTKLLQQGAESLTKVWDKIEAFELLFEASDFEAAAYALVEAHQFLDRRGYDRFLEERYQKLLSELDGPALALVEHRIGLANLNLGLFQQAIEQFRRDLTTSEAADDQAGVALSLARIGATHFELGEFAEASSQIEAGLAIARKTGNRALISKLLNDLGMAKQACGKYDEALGLFNQSLALGKELGQRTGVAKSLINIGNIYRERKEYKTALESYERARAIYNELLDRVGLSKCLLNIGVVRQERGEYASALEQFRLALAIKEELGDRSGIANAFHNIAVVHEECEEEADAIKYYLKALEIYQELGNKASSASSLCQIGRLYTELRLYDDAFQSLFNALGLFLVAGSPNSEIAGDNLEYLRARWGTRNFSRAWQDAMNRLQPE